MLVIKIDEKETIEKALKRYKRKFEKTKVLKELRERKTFTKKPVKNREKLNKEIYVYQKFNSSED